MKYIKSLLIIILLVFISIAPVVYAQTPPAATGGIVECFSNCGFNELINLINKVVNWLLFVVSLPLAAIIFAYAGFKLLFSGGNHHDVEQAKSIFKNVVLGLVLACAAWLIVHTILSTLGYDGSWIGF